MSLLIFSIWIFILAFFAAMEKPLWQLCTGFGIVIGFALLYWVVTSNTTFHKIDSKKDDIQALSWRKRRNVDSISSPLKISASFDLNPKSWKMLPEDSSQVTSPSNSFEDESRKNPIPMELCVAEVHVNPIEADDSDASVSDHLCKANEPVVEFPTSPSCQSKEKEKSTVVLVQEITKIQPKPDEQPSTSDIPKKQILTKIFPIKQQSTSSNVDLPTTQEFSYIRESHSSLDIQTIGCKKLKPIKEKTFGSDSKNRKSKDSRAAGPSELVFANKVIKNVKILKRNMKNSLVKIDSDGWEVPPKRIFSPTITKTNLADKESEEAVLGPSALRKKKLKTPQVEFDSEGWEIPPEHILLPTKTKTDSTNKKSEKPFELMEQKLTPQVQFDSEGWEVPPEHILSPTKTETHLMDKTKDIQPGPSGLSKEKSKACKVEIDREGSEIQPWHSTSSTKVKTALKIWEISPKSVFEAGSTSESSDSSALRARSKRKNIRPTRIPILSPVQNKGNLQKYKTDLKTPKSKTSPKITQKPTHILALSPTLEKQTDFSKALPSPKEKSDSESSCTPTKMQVFQIFLKKQFQLLQNFWTLISILESDSQKK